MLILQLGYDPNVIPIGLVVGFISIFLVVWNASKKITTLENDAKAGKEQHYTDIKELKDKISDIERNFIQRASDFKSELKEEIESKVGNNVGKFDGLQKQIGDLRSDLKDSSTRVTAVNTRLEEKEKQLEDLRDTVKDNRSFHTNELHITDNTIEIVRKEICELRNQFINMFRSFHGNSKHTE